jgi:hypothetical protein
MRTARWQWGFRAWPEIRRYRQASLLLAQPLERCGPYLARTKMPVITVEHPSEDLLERYSMGRLTEAEVAPLEEHLLICGECRNRGVLMDCDVAAIREPRTRLEIRRGGQSLGTLGPTLCGSQHPERNGLSHISLYARRSGLNQIINLMFWESATICSGVL